MFFANRSNYNFNKDKKINSNDFRISAVSILFAVFALIIIFRLFILMILQHGFYIALASSSQDMYAQLFPRRGEIFIQNSRTKEKFPVAINQDLFLMYVDPRQIKSDEKAEEILQKLNEVFSYTDEKKQTVLAQLKKNDDPYEQLEDKVNEEQANKIRELNLPGINFVRIPYRFYPENSLVAPVVGFLGKDENGNNVGRYGIEGYWNKELAGKSGFLEGKKALKGSWISSSERLFEPSEDGSDLILTIDRTLQFKACQELSKAKEINQAKSASLIIVEPSTGAILAMCSLPDFDSNNYNKVESVEVFNNQAIFVPYEPGSIFKPIVMSVAINEGLVKPETVFHDTGSKEGLCQKPIKNAGEKIYGDQTMTGVLENSINTGMIFVAEKIGKKKLIKYLEDFGFGILSGVGMETEMTGSISTLSESKSDKIDCYGATASFGQGITATPLQMVMAFSAIANGGSLMKPYIIDEIKHENGKVEKTKPIEIKKVLNKRATGLIAGMMVKVVDNGHAKKAGVRGYFVAAKTGTAQIPGKGGYTDETIHSLIGFAPVDNPKFVMIVKLEKTNQQYAESTVAPVFGDIAKFILEYYKIPPER